MTTVPAEPAHDPAFEESVAPHRAGLEAHCYRMLGSAADAEDALQETLLRAWRGLEGFEGRSSLRSWLYTIATNVCLRALEQRSRRSLPIDMGPAADPRSDFPERLSEQTWLEPFPDTALGDGAAGPAARYEERESVELAFIAAIQHLPARQRAVLLLRDVLGFAPAEIAATLGVSATAVSSMLQRAHRTVDDRLPERSQQSTLHALGDRRLREVVDRYVRAWQANDVAGLKAMLAHEAVMAMPPQPAWFQGADAVADFLARWPLSGRYSWRMVPCRLNHQLAFASYGGAETPGGRHAAHAVQVLTLDERGAVRDMTAFLDVRHIERLGLPDAIDG